MIGDVKSTKPPPRVREHPGGTAHRERMPTVDEPTISPAGDPFYAASRHLDEREPCSCYGGVVYIGHLVEGEDGEEAEVVHPVPCRRCSDSR
jgi:hypothetical protein